MSTVTIESTTDTPEQVLAALGKKVEPEADVDSKKSATESEDMVETNEESETSEDADESDEQENSEDDKKQKPKNGFKKRIDRLNQRVSERDSEIASLRYEYEKLKSEKAKESTQETKAKGDNEPDPQDFETNAEYIRAYTKWEVNQLKKSQAEEDQKRSANESRSKVQRDYDAKLVELKKTATDFDDVLADFVDEHKQFNASPEVVEAIQTSDYGPQVFYEILKTPGEYERLSKLSPLAQIREIGKIEAKIALKSEQSAEIKKTTKAPSPVKPTSSSSARAEKDPDKMSYEEFKKWREKNG